MTLPMSPRHLANPKPELSPNHSQASVASVPLSQADAERAALAAKVDNQAENVFPNGTGSGVPVVEDTGRVEQRVASSASSIASSLSNAPHTKTPRTTAAPEDASAAAAEAAAVAKREEETEKRKDDELHDYLHSYFGDQQGATNVGDGDDNGENEADDECNSDDGTDMNHIHMHSFQSKLINGLRKFRPQSVSGASRRRSLAATNQAAAANQADANLDASDELLKREQHKLEVVIDSLVAGYPSVLLASSYFVTDEQGRRKIPMVLLQLSLSVEDVSTKTQRRLFKFYLEYGVGNHKMTWHLYRDYKQLINFHNKMKVQALQENVLTTGTGRKDIEMPKLPKYSSRRYPFAPGNESSARVAAQQSRSHPAATGTTDTANGAASATSQGQGGRPQPQQHANGAVHDDRKMLLPEIGAPPHTQVLLERPESLRRSSSAESQTSSAVSSISSRSTLSRAFQRVRLGAGGSSNAKAITTAQALEDYFEELFNQFLLRSEASRIFQFFELSPMSTLLSQEGVKKSKEGYLFIKTTAKAQGWRVGHLKYRDFKAMVVRHTSKWFVLGPGYIFYVSDINSTTPLDVFLVDPEFKLTIPDVGDITGKDPSDKMQELMRQHMELDDTDSDNDDESFTTTGGPRPSKNTRIKHFSMTFENSERKISVVSKSAKQIKDWAFSIYKMIHLSPFSVHHRFDSFAPIRQNCYAQWLVDGRDHMWAVSSALEMAKDVIYIHDWWLTPELYLRRPADGNQEWRIDRVLKRKAEQGVKIFVIVYRNVGNTVVTDSLWTKHSLLDLHPNIHVLRSPNQLMQNVFFWAHHEKLVIVDQSVCFIGGIDLCFGRWDTPDHVLVDDSPYAFEGQIPPGSTSGIKNPAQKSYQIFPGKDYSNPRVSDFYELQKPFEDMYDRQIVPRMPWHDVHMVTCGQIARDLSHHFVQRWNYLLRQKRPSRPTPLLLPPRDFTEDELEKLGFKGKCEIQLVRSSGAWSLGLKETEMSIQNAYIKLIETSEHFVYIENQFFITSCEVDGTIVVNRLGDALVDRIIRAHRNHETWKAVIVIPLLPGFPSNVDKQDASAMRLIIRCQYMSISMGESSIFAKLQRMGINPEDYIQFYSLRRWGMIGKQKLLTTEQLYIHAKVMVVDDRTAIIGSANINERSMRGMRDSEVCAVVRDKDMIDSRMDGVKYPVGRFAHTLRMRLMREHLGVDVDLLDLVERRFSEIETFAGTTEGLAAATSSGGCDPKLSAMVELGTRFLLDIPEGTPAYQQKLTKSSGGGADLTKKMLGSFDEPATLDNSSLDDIPYIYSFNHRAGAENVGIRDRKPFSTDTRVTSKEHQDDVKGMGQDKYMSYDYLDSKARFNKFMAKASETATEDDPLPEYEDIMEYLTAVDDNMPLDELNRERWTMLKRLYYMAKVKCKEKYLEQESKKSSPNGTAAATAATAAVANGSAAATSTAGVSASISNLTGSSVPIATLQSHDVKAVPHGVHLPDIPTTTLTDAEINEIDKDLLPQTVGDFIDPYAFDDPLDIDFFEGTWMPQAIRNTTLYAIVFHAQPDDTVANWKDYTHFQDLKNAFMEHQKLSRGYYSTTEEEDQAEEDSSPLGPQTATESSTPPTTEEPSSPNSSADHSNVRDTARSRLRRARMAELDRFQRGINNTGVVMGELDDYKSNSIYDYETAKKLLSITQGRLVRFPTRWLKAEVEGSNWFYKADKLPPIAIYN